MDVKDKKIHVKIDADLKELIPGYINNRYLDIENIIIALEKSDYETIRILGHSMKGSGGGYGFDAITEIGGVIEAAAKEKNNDVIKGKVEELKDYLSKIEIIYV
ncbi:MAG TPA: Hpt domain-containing protein [Syntrophorhabdaceae bacterium]|nr:Hpt domain-containing protein [Syntrophorhabdaceae bacterium]